MNRFIFYLSRVAICILLLVIYFFGWRPVRTAITQSVVYPVLKENVNDAVNTYHIKNNGVSLQISFEWNENPKTIQYRPQAGFFFLIACIAMLFVTSKIRWYLILAAFHLIMTFASAAIVILSKGGWYPGFIITDFLVTYFTPALTLAYAGWIIARKKDADL